MLRNAFNHFTDTGMTTFGLLIFAGFFLTLLVWVYLPVRKKFYKKMSQLPLESED